jgi:two-component system osmolarity sensor histidine kinase EnvZ
MPIILIQAISAFVFFDRHLESVIRQTAILKAEEIGSIVSLIQQLPESPDLIKQEAERLELTLELFPSQLSSKRTHFSFSDKAGDLFEKALRGHLKEDHTLTESDTHFFIHVFTPHRTMKFTLSKRRFTNRTSDIFVMWSLGTSILFTLISWFFMRNQIRPIKQLARAADQFGRNNKFDPLRPSGALEVRKAGEAFNVMQERIKRYIEQRTEMLAGVSHDLRTPLTRMRLHLELLPESTDTLALKRDLSEMDTMVRNFLEYVREERLEKAEQLAMAPVIREVAQRYFMPALQCAFFLDDRIVRTVRPQAFRRLLMNIFSNCRRYAKSAQVNLIKTEKNIVLTIEDDGPGIPEKYRQDVFEPFFRLDASRTPGKGGSGLGLSTARDLVVSMGGAITLAASPLGGLSVVVCFPDEEES